MEVCQPLQQCTGDMVNSPWLRPAKYRETEGEKDIDTDLSRAVRGKVIVYVADKYAYKEDYPIDELRSTVCNIATEGTLAAKAAIRAAARITEVDLPTTDKVAKLVPNKPKMTIAKAMEESSELREMYAQDPTIHQLIDDAKLMEGIPSQTGVHAAGVIIADKPVVEYAPMLWNEEVGGWVIESDMVACEMDLGLLKMDFLGLKNLDILYTAAFYVRRAEGVDINFKAVNQADDPKVIQNIYATGNTEGIFQFESAGITKYLMEFQPKTFDDIILMNAAYRPGPMQFIPDITDIKFGRKSPHYIVPEMEPILKNTYGNAIYQEQIMQLFQLVGFSLGEADVIRRAMSKKHLDEIEAAKDKFVQGMLDRGGKPEDIEVFWTQLLAFASYAFNKSHAAAYSIVSYYTAWLKYYHPGCYIAALMSYAEISEIAAYALDAKNHGVALLKPDINTGVPNFAPTVGAKAIRYGLKTIKGVAGAANAIYQARQDHGDCQSLADYTVRACLYGIASSATEALIRSGALDTLCSNRKKSLNVVTELTEKCRRETTALRKQKPDITDNELYEALLPSMSLKAGLLLAPDVEDFPLAERLKDEYKYLGVYVSGNPTDPHRETMVRMREDAKRNSYRNTVVTTRELLNRGENDENQPSNVSIVGMVNDISILRRKSDGAPMAKFTLMDEFGSVPAVMFTKLYKECGHLIHDGVVISVEAKVSEENTGNNSEVQLSIQKVAEAITQ